jgi:hypothetical protein
MRPQVIFGIDAALAYLAWGLLISAYIWPRLKAMDTVEAHRATATFNSFRFFGLVFLLPGFVGPNLPQSFAAQAAYLDLATGVLATLALLTLRVRVLFWPLVWAFNLIGLADIIMDYVVGVRLNLPAIAGQLGAGYAILMLYVPGLVLMHVVAFRLLLQPGRRATSSSGASMSFAPTK